MENNALTLSQIGLYNPQRLSDDVVEKLFIVRTKLFQFLMEKLKKEKPNGIPQHYLIIAQRGMGKTTLLKRMEVELRKDENKNSFIPLLFPEEQYNLKNLAEFWLNSLDALADTLEFEKKTSEAKIVDEKVKELAKIKIDEDLAKEAFQFLKSFTQKLGRRPVLLIDNMSFIFDRMNKDQQHTLRAWFMQNGAPILVGASAVAIEDTFNYGAPFYDAFQIHYLKKLEFDELIDIVTNLAKLTQSEDVLSSIQTQMPRIKTLHQLTGGNPRTATMLFKLIIKGFSKEINDDLEALLDEITPLYKARFEELSIQMQVIVDAIALYWDPINIEQLREETRYDNNQLSPQLKRLVELGWIEKINAYKAKGNAYQISERFFNIWFLMRRSSRRQKRELYCLSKFLEVFYGDDVKDVAQKLLSNNKLNQNQITYSLALSEIVKNDDMKFDLIKKVFDELSNQLEFDPFIFEKFDFEIRKPLDEFIRIIDIFRKNSENIQEIDIINKFNKFIELNDYFGFNDFLIETINDTQEKLDLINLTGAELINKYYLEKLYLFDENKQILNGFKDLQSGYPKLLSIFYSMLGANEEIAFKSFLEAKRLFEISVELDKNNIASWKRLGILYQRKLFNYPNAENAYLKVIELDKTDTISNINLITISFDKLNKQKEAEEILNSIELSDEYVDSYWLHKSIFELRKKNEGQAKVYYLKALEKIEDKLPVNTQDDWWRFGAVVHKMGYNKWLTNILEETGYDVILSPFYIAIKALGEKDSEGYLNSKAVELRTPAKELMDWMIKYNES